MRRVSSAFVGSVLLLLLTACNGILEDLYDRAPVPAAGDLYIDASSWTQWHYIDFHALQEAAEGGDSTAAAASVSGAASADTPHAQAAIQTFDIPLERTDAFDADSTGIFTYWYDVFGEGISRRERRDCYPTTRQPEPAHWDIAIHRNNVRTNGGAALETSLTDISQVGTAAMFATSTFVPDTSNETDVWTVQEHMLQGIVGNQRIPINTELGKWLKLDIPPMPPAFTHNANVFIVRLADGSLAALRLKNYIGQDNVKCRLTIEYKYPL